MKQYHKFFWSILQNMLMLRLIHTYCGNGNGKNGLYWTLWVAIAFAAGLHVNTSIGSDATHSWRKNIVVVAVAVAAAQCEQAFNVIWVLYLTAGTSFVRKN